MMAANPAEADVGLAGFERGMRWRRIFAGDPAQVAEVRRFVACLLKSAPPGTLWSPARPNCPRTR